MPMCVFIFSVAFTLNILCAFMKFATWLTLLVLDLVLYLFVMVFYNLMSLFGIFYTYGITRDCDYGVSDFIKKNCILGKFSLSWYNC